MFQPYQLSIALRYLRARSRDSFISFISLVSMLGIGLAVAVLIVVISVMNGFEYELQQKILGMVSDATIIGYEGPLEDWEAVREHALERPDVVAAAPFIEGEGMAVFGDNFAGVGVRGIVPGLESGVTTLADEIVEGDYDSLGSDGYNMLIGRALADELGVKLGDKVVLLLAEARVTPAGIAPRARAFTITGIFDAGMYEYDRGLALLNIEDARRLLRLGGDVTGLRYAFEKPYMAPARIRQIAVDLGGGFYISDWTRSHANFFRSIQVTRSIMLVVLLLVVGVAAFNIVSTLVMVVKEKQGDIAILRTLGSSPREILSVFVIQGTTIGVVGTVLGMGLGIALALNLTAIVHGLEGLMNTTLVDARVYYIDNLPADIRLRDVLTISATALALGVLSTVYPAWRAAGTAPADALRHEV